MNIQNLKDELVNISKSIQQGAIKADKVMGGRPSKYDKSASTAGGVNSNYKQGSSTVGRGLGYGQSVFDPRFKKSMAAEGVTLGGTPAQFLGAYAARLAVDAANDGTRTYWWRYNHPLAIAQAGVETAVNKDLIKSPTGRALTALSISLPAVAAAGTYDITNPEEQFRPKGFAQSYSELGSEDRRQTAQPVQELFERFFLGRTGEPLKYETAKQDIPDLTPERYGNYMNYLYNDKGVLGAGILKGTSENLQGVPEARLLGFPVSIPMVAGFAGGTLGARQGALIASKPDPKIPNLVRRGTPTQRIAGAIAGGLAGSLGGVAVGNAINESIAAGNRPTYPSTLSYPQSM
jgi:hypothetical protein